MSLVAIEGRHGFAMSGVGFQGPLAGSDVFDAAMSRHISSPNLNRHPGDVGRAWRWFLLPTGPVA